MSSYYDNEVMASSSNARRCQPYAHGSPIRHSYGTVADNKRNDIAHRFHGGGNSDDYHRQDHEDRQMNYNAHNPSDEKDWNNTNRNNDVGPNRNAHSNSTYGNSNSQTYKENHGYESGIQNHENYFREERSPRAERIQLSGEDRGHPTRADSSSPQLSICASPNYNMDDFCNWIENCVAHNADEVDIEKHYQCLQYVKDLCKRYQAEQLKRNENYKTILTPFINSHHSPVTEMDSQYRNDVDKDPDTDKSFIATDTNTVHHDNRYVDEDYNAVANMTNRTEINSSSTYHSNRSLRYICTNKMCPYRNYYDRSEYGKVKSRPPSVVFDPREPLSQGFEKKSSSLSSLTEMDTTDNSGCYDQRKIKGQPYNTEEDLLERQSSFHREAYNDAAPKNSKRHSKFCCFRRKGRSNKPKKNVKVHIDCHCAYGSDDFHNDPTTFNSKRYIAQDQSDYYYDNVANHGAQHSQNLDPYRSEYYSISQVSHNEVHQLEHNNGNAANQGAQGGQDLDQYRNESHEPRDEVHQSGQYKGNVATHGARQSSNYDHYFTDFHSEQINEFEQGNVGSHVDRNRTNKDDIVDHQYTPAGGIVPLEIHNDHYSSQGGELTESASTYDNRHWMRNNDDTHTKNFPGHRVIDSNRTYHCTAPCSRYGKQNDEETHYDHLSRYKDNNIERTQNREPETSSHNDYNDSYGKVDHYIGQGRDNPINSNQTDRFKTHESYSQHKHDSGNTENNHSDQHNNKTYSTQDKYDSGNTEGNHSNQYNTKTVSTQDKYNSGNTDGNHSYQHHTETYSYQDKYDSRNTKGNHFNQHNTETYSSQDKYDSGNTKGNHSHQHNSKTYSTQDKNDIGSPQGNHSNQHSAYRGHEPVVGGSQSHIHGEHEEDHVHNNQIDTQRTIHVDNDNSNNVDVNEKPNEFPNTDLSIDNRDQERQVDRANSERGVHSNNGEVHDRYGIQEDNTHETVDNGLQGHHRIKNEKVTEEREGLFNNHGPREQMDRYRTAGGNGKLIHTDIDRSHSEMHDKRDDLFEPSNLYREDQSSKHQLHDDLKTHRQIGSEFVEHNVDRPHSNRTGTHFSQSDEHLDNGEKHSIYHYTTDRKHDSYYHSNDWDPRDHDTNRIQSHHKNEHNDRRINDLVDLDERNGNSKNHDLNESNAIRMRHNSHEQKHIVSNIDHDIEGRFVRERSDFGTNKNIVDDYSIPSNREHERRPYVNEDQTDNSVDSQNDQSWSKSQQKSRDCHGGWYPNCVPDDLENIDIKQPTSDHPPDPMVSTVVPDHIEIHDKVGSVHRQSGKQLNEFQSYEASKKNIIEQLVVPERLKKKLDTSENDSDYDMDSRRGLGALNESPLYSEREVVTKYTYLGTPDEATTVTVHSTEIQTNSMPLKSILKDPQKDSYIVNKNSKIYTERFQSERNENVVDNLNRNAFGKSKGPSVVPVVNGTHNEKPSINPCQRWTSNGPPRSAAQFKTSKGYNYPSKIAITQARQSIFTYNNFFSSARRNSPMNGRRLPE